MQGYKLTGESFGLPATWKFLGIGKRIPFVFFEDENGVRRAASLEINHKPQKPQPTGFCKKMANRFKRKKKKKNAGL